MPGSEHLVLLFIGHGPVLGKPFIEYRKLGLYPWRSVLQFVEQGQKVVAGLVDKSGQIRIFGEGHLVGIQVEIPSRATILRLE